MITYHRHVTITPSDACDCSHGDIPEGECEHDAWLVRICCEDCGRELSSICGSKVEFPNDGSPYALVSGPTFYTLARELYFDSGFTWVEEG